MHSNMDEPQKNPAVWQEVGKRNTYDMTHKHKIPSNGTESQWWWPGDGEEGWGREGEEDYKGAGDTVGMCLQSLSSL